MNANHMRARQADFARTMEDPSTNPIPPEIKSQRDEEYKEADEIAKKWLDVEARYANIRVEVEGLPLSCKRFGSNSRLRLVWKPAPDYEERPLTDCRVNEKIAAAVYLRDFLRHRKEAIAKMKKDSVIALHMMDEVLAEEGE